MECLRRVGGEGGSLARVSRGGRVRIVEAPRAIGSRRVVGLLLMHHRVVHVSNGTQRKKRWGI